MKKKMTNRDIRSEQTKQRICDTAIRLFHEYGYENTTINDICEASGVSSGSFFHYFGTKSGVLLRYKHIKFNKEDFFSINDKERLDLNPQEILHARVMLIAVTCDDIGRDLMAAIYNNYNLVLSADNGIFLDDIGVENTRNFFEKIKENDAENRFDISDKATEILLTFYTGAMYIWTFHTENVSACEFFEQLFPELIRMLIHEKENV